MGLNAAIDVKKYGYYPKGNGEITLTIEPSKKLTPIRLEEFGNITTIKGMSVCTFLDDRKVAERQAKAANQRLKDEGYTADIRVVNDKSNPLQKGSSIVIWAETDTGAIIGADAIGELKKASEKVGDEAAQKLLEEIRYKPTVDLHLADLLIPYIALAQGKSVFLTRALSEHLETNIWLAEEILGTSFKVEKTDKLYKIEKN
jgi:RNA 3'-terminal phosphate cyclase (ATP)